MKLIGSLFAAFFITLGVGLLIPSVTTKTPEQSEDTALVAAVSIPPLPTEPVDISPIQGGEFYYGSSTKGHQLTGYTYGSGEQTLVFVGGIHGGYEWNTTLLAEQLREHLRTHPQFIPEDIRVVIIPSANPDGLDLVVDDITRFTADEIATNTIPARFNARGVDLNRNFDCQHEPEALWRTTEVDAGAEPFSEIESLALANYLEIIEPTVVIFWHSAAAGVYESHCGEKQHPDTNTIAAIYADAANYPHYETFDNYPVTGDASDWLATVDIPAITVELSTHDSTEWAKNLAGFTAVVGHYSQY